MPGRFRKLEAYATLLVTDVVSVTGRAVVAGGIGRVASCTGLAIERLEIGQRIRRVMLLINLMTIHTASHCTDTQMRPVREFRELASSTNLLACVPNRRHLCGGCVA